MKRKEENNNKSMDASGNHELSRRGFLKIVGVFAISATGAGLISCDKDTIPDLSPGVSLGYILVDTKKCQGCLTCMISCSLVNEGCVNLSLSRIQVVQNTLGCYPDNIHISQCRQCENPKCVDACPNAALIIDKEHGNVRLVKPNNCIGCGRCVMACPYEPKKPIIAPDERFGELLKSRKCDLCINAPHHFASVGGGIEGVRACETMCPLGAITFATEMPEQEGDEGYEVNLRGLNWAFLGYDIS
ncbi:MAG: 4Fe-4S dicluster domain-containing protein [Proteobacteria bacterium]|nr:4Fe-4S dicluster domain-containing protein [Pseudomonadota bacterium]